MSSITIDICRSNGFLISIRNDGKGLPVELDPKECIYVPALVFGHLLSGSNFNDNEVKIFKLVNKTALFDLSIRYISRFD